jgi:hypothetical protein
MKHVRTVTKTLPKTALSWYQPGGKLYCAKLAYIEWLWAGGGDILDANYDGCDD